MLPSIPTLSNGWLCTVAVLLSLYQGFAGWNYGLFIHDASRGSEKQPPRAPPWLRQAVYGAHHGVWYFVCSFAGFGALSLFGEIGRSVPMSGVSASLLVGLGTLSVLGISGALARLLFFGQKLW